ncbi:type VI secretion system baseplate subunit TssF [Xylophilus sp. GOD-11R]|uniref:type VI secretion system baseplate subunit TssF n=1 Tax=Xylophilus sp. GOD-11R TaxID=3089814 RepID=UPI00298D261B|nr:type VI secretion system baseplate subunit TssF [Xylophilus sp. GOD-11R]WPB55352.1 type VI secretion system baseplate subunit TssF [Xylophilus sp. GOD-11R]
MEPQLLQYYNEELIYMRELAGEFAGLHPKIARRLGMQPGEVADPYVERLLEGFSFMSARMRIKLDAEFPRFTQRLLEVLYPNYVSPTPSMAVVRFQPDPTHGDLRRGFGLPRGTALFARVAPGERTACEFRTGQELTLWPIELTQVVLGDVPPDIPALERRLPAGTRPRASLRLRLRLMGEGGFADLRGLDRLPVQIAGDPAVASRLFELLQTAACATLIAAPGELSSTRQPAHVVGESPLVPDGWEPSQSLLPLRWTSFHGHNLLHEYAACPERFLRFSLRGLAAGLARIPGSEADVVVLLDKPGGDLDALVDAGSLALHCVPVINLFEHRTDHLALEPGATEFHLVPDRSRPLDFEVHSVVSMQGEPDAGGGAVEFRPLYDTVGHDHGDHGRYFSLRREARTVSLAGHRYGARSAYAGTEVFASLVDQHEAPWPGELRQLGVSAWLTNRDLPALVPSNGRDDLQVGGLKVPVLAAGFLRRPTRPHPPAAVGETAWRLIRQLGFNHLPLTELDAAGGGRALRDMLGLFVAGDGVVARAEIAALVGSRLDPVTRRLPGAGPLVYGRGVLCTLTVDEAGFSGGSPYLFGLVLSHYLARHVSINTFVETRLESLQRGEIARWPARPGTREAV